RHPGAVADHDRVHVADPPARLHQGRQQRVHAGTTILISRACGWAATASSTARTESSGVSPPAGPTTTVSPSSRVNAYPEPPARAVTPGRPAYHARHSGRAPPETRASRAAASGRPPSHRRAAPARPAGRPGGPYR